MGTLSGCEMVVGERVVGRASLATADPDDPAAIEGGDQRGVLVALPVVTSSTSQVYVAESAGNDQWTVTSWNSCMRSFSWSPHVAELRADGGAGVRVRAALQEEEFRRSARRALEAVGQAAVVQVTKARAGSSMALRFLELTGRGLLPKHRDQACSFTDCTSFVVMHQLRVSQVITSDEHFRIAGFEGYRRTARSSDFRDYRRLASEPEPVPSWGRARSAQGRWTVYRPGDVVLGRSMETSRRASRRRRADWTARLESPVPSEISVSVSSTPASFRRRQRYR